MEPIDNISRFWILVSGCTMLLKFSPVELRIIQDQVSSFQYRSHKAAVYRLSSKMVKQIDATLGRIQRHVNCIIILNGLVSRRKIVVVNGRYPTIFACNNMTILIMISI